MIIEKNFDFGKVSVDPAKELIMLDRGQGLKEYESTCDNSQEFKQVMDWIHSSPELDYYDKSLLSWKYRICGNCVFPDEKQTQESLDYLKIDSPKKKDEVRLEVVGKNRTYILRRVPDLGLVLIHPDQMVYLLGNELYWMSSDGTWKKVQEFDEIDMRFVTEVIGANPRRFFE